MASSRLISATYWTVGTVYTWKVAKDISTYRHTLDFYLGSTVLKSVSTGTATSGTVQFTVAENTQILQTMGNTFELKSKVRIITYDANGNRIGSRDFELIYYNPAHDSIITYNETLTVGKTYTYSVSPAISSLRWTIGVAKSSTSTPDIVLGTANEAKNGTFNINTKTLENTFYNLFAGHASQTYNCYLVVVAYYNGYQIMANARWITVDLQYAPPVFGASTITHLDSNSTTTAITGDNQYIIQDKSNLKVTLPAGSLATGRFGATIVSYQCTFGSKSISLASTGNALTFDMGTTNLDNSAYITITVFDSRGNKATIKKYISVIPYSPPTVSVTAKRATAFSENISVTVNGKYYRLRVGSVNKGTITSATAYISINDGSFTAYTLTKTVSDSVNPASYTANTSRTLSLGSIAKVYVVIQDTLGTTVTSPTIEIPAGIPIFYLDSKLGSAGFLAVPSTASTFKCGMKIDLPFHQYYTSTDKSYGINMNNSDLINCNKITFNDYSGGRGEGIFWLNTNSATGNQYVDDDNMSIWTQTYWRDNKFYLNNAHRLSIEDEPTTPSWKKLVWKGCHSFVIEKGSFDTELSDYDGFCIKSSQNGALKFDENEMLVVNATDTDYKDFHITASYIGMYLKQGLRLQYGTDVDITNTNYAGLTLEAGTWSGTTFTANGNVLKLDANELICGNTNDDTYTEMYYKAGGHTFQGGSVTSTTDFKLKRASTYAGYSRFYKNHSADTDYGTYIYDYDENGNYALLQLRSNTNTLTLTNAGMTIGADRNFYVGNLRLVNNTIQNKANNTSLYFSVKNASGTAVTSLQTGLGTTDTYAFVQSKPTYDRTTTSSANMYINSYGTMFRSTSSAKAKLDIVPAFDTLEDYKQILNIEPVKWFDKGDTEMYAQSLTSEYTNEEFDCQAGFGNLNRIYGCVAEQLEEVGLGCLVDYDSENNEIMGVAYDRIPIMYIPLIKDLYNQIDALKQEIETLK